jgi:hypothetical protein
MRDLTKHRHPPVIQPQSAVHQKTSPRCIWNTYLQVVAE